MAPITLVFTHAEKEYVAATRWFFARVYHTRFLLVLSSIVFSVGLLLVLVGVDFVFAGAALIVGLILFLLNFYVYFVMPAQHFRRNSKFRDEYSLQFTDEGLRFQTKGVESKIEWSFYSKVLEAPQFYALRYDRDLFTLIPKRVFASNKQEADFRDLLNRKLGSTLDIQVSLGGSSGSYEFPPAQGPPDWR